MIAFSKIRKCLLTGAILLVGVSMAEAQVVLPPINPTPSSTQPLPVSEEEPSLEEKVKKLEQELMKLKTLEQELMKLKEQARKQEEEKKKKEEEEKKKKEEESDPKKIAEKVKKLEDEWKKQKEEEEKKEAEEKKKNPPVEIRGRIHVDQTSFLNDSRGIGFFEHPDPSEDNFGTDPENRLFFRRLRLTFQGEIRDNMVYKLDLEFGDPEEMAFRDALLGFENLPGNHRLIFGNQKRPFSLDDWNSSNDNVFMERPLVSQAFSDETRRVGVQIYGYTDDESLNWQAGVFQLENIATTGNYVDDPFQGSINGRVSGTPFYDECSGGRNYLHLGVAGMTAWPNGFADDADGTPNQARFSSRPELRSASRWIDTGRIVGADWFHLLALEAALNLGPFSLVGEYMTTWVGRSSRPEFVNPGTTLNFNGFYVYAAYFLTGEAQKWDRKTGTLSDLDPFENFFLVERLCGRSGGGWGAWQVAVRYSYLNLSSDDVLGGRQSNVTFGLNWWWNPHARLMLNYVIGEIDNHRPVGGFTEGNFHGMSTRLHIDW